MIKKRTKSILLKIKFQVIFLNLLHSSIQSLNRGSEGMTTIDDGEACKPMSRDPYVTRAPTVLPTTEMVFNTLYRICIQCVYTKLIQIKNVSANYSRLPSPQPVQPTDHPQQQRHFPLRLLSHIKMLPLMEIHIIV